MSLVESIVRQMDAWNIGSRGTNDSAIRNPQFAIAALLFLGAALAPAQVAVRGKTVYTMDGPPIKNGIVVAMEGKITYIGPAASSNVPDGVKVLDAEVVTPGLIDAHCVVGLTGIYNQPHDSDQVERSTAIQPELRALDAYNPQEKLVEWVRSFGVTTVHTGHAPEELIPGQTFIVKTTGNTVEEAALVNTACVAAVIGEAARKGGDKSPGTRGKMQAMLRGEFIKAQEYAEKRDKAEPDKKPERNLRYEVLARVLKGELPLLVTAERAQDIESALRLAKEFKLRLILDGGSESYLLTDEIKSANIPVIIHPSMKRAWGEMENMSFETAAKLRHAGIPVALQGGWEDYVPKVRVVLYEAAIAAANGLTFEEALGTITIDAARILGIDQRVGSLKVGKDADFALYDGDPFEYTTHCVGTVIDGKVVSTVKR